MKEKMSRRDFAGAAAVAGAMAATGAWLPRSTPAFHVPPSIKPVVIADMSGLRYRNGGSVCCVEKRMLNFRGEPNFNIRFFILNAKGQHAGVTMDASGETTYAVCTENGAQSLPLEPLLSGSPTD